MLLRAQCADSSSRMRSPSLYKRIVDPETLLLGVVSVAIPVFLYLKGWVMLRIGLINALHRTARTMNLLCN